MTWTLMVSWIAGMGLGWALHVLLDNRRRRRGYAEIDLTRRNVERAGKRWEDERRAFRPSDQGRLKPRPPDGKKPLKRPDLMYECGKRRPSRNALYPE